jgi:hypothetical protein
MPKWKFSVEAHDSDGQSIKFLSGDVSGPNTEGARQALADAARSQGYEPFEIGLFPDGR